MTIDSRYRVLSVAERHELVTTLDAIVTATAQPVAIKVFSVRQDEKDRSALGAEIRRIAGLRHPHIAALLDWGSLPDGWSYVVHEMPDGEALSRVLAARGALPEDEARHLMIQVLDALAFAHRRGLEHRELNPSKIIVCEGGVMSSAVIVEFGMYSIIEVARSVEIGSLTGALGGVSATAYMSPSQLDFKVSHRADLYAWGLTFIECLSGRAVISGSPMDVIRQLAAEEPVLLPDCLLDHPLRPVLQRTINKSGAKRFDSARQIYRALIDGEPPGEQPVDSGAPPVTALKQRLAMYTEQSQWGRAVEVLQQLCELEESPHRRAKYYFTAAVLMRDQLDDQRRAVDLFNETLDADVNAMRAFSNITGMLHAAGDIEGLVDNYRRMIQRLQGFDDPEHNERRSKLWRRLAQIYRSDMRLLDQALSCLESALRSHPDDERTRQLLREIEGERELGSAPWDHSAASGDTKKHPH